MCSNLRPRCGDSPHHPHTNPHTNPHTIPTPIPPIHTLTSTSFTHSPPHAHHPHTNSHIIHSFTTTPTPMTPTLHHSTWSSIRVFDRFRDPGSRIRCSWLSKNLGENYVLLGTPQRRSVLMQRSFLRENCFFFNLYDLKRKESRTMVLEMFLDFAGNSIITTSACRLLTNVCCCELSIFPQCIWKWKPQPHHANTMRTPTPNHASSPIHTPIPHQNKIPTPTQDTEELMAR